MRRFTTIWVQEGLGTRTTVHSKEVMPRRIHGNDVYLHTFRELMFMVNIGSTPHPVNRDSLLKM